MDPIKLLLIALMVALVACLILLSGCTAQDSQSGAQTNNGNGNSQPQAPVQGGNATQQAGWNGFSRGMQNSTGGQGFINASNRGAGRNGSGAMIPNLTAEQRQQMTDARAQQMAAACSGKTAGDACGISSPRDNVTGSCTPLNGMLSCSFGGFG